MSHAAWPEATTRDLMLSEFDERFRCYRPSIMESERAGGICEAIWSNGSAVRLRLCQRIFADRWHRSVTSSVGSIIGLSKIQQRKTPERNRC